MGRTLIFEDRKTEYCMTGSSHQNKNFQIGKAIVSPLKKACFSQKRAKIDLYHKYMLQGLGDVINIPLELSLSLEPIER